MKPMLMNRVGWTARIQRQSTVTPGHQKPQVSILRLGLLPLVLLLVSFASPATLWAQPPGGGGTTNCMAAPAGLVSWWRAETNALDSASSHHGMLLNSAGFAPGMAGWAFNFSGSDQLVVANAPALNPTNALSIETWVYLPAYPTNDSSVVVGKDAPPATCQYLISVSRVQGQHVFRPHVGVPGGLHYFNGTTPVQTNTWYHVAMTYDGALLRLYVNGNLDGSQAVSGPMVTNGNPLQVGGYGCGPWNLIGRVDELALYNRALSAAEILTIYHAGSAGKCPSSPTVAPAILFQPTNLTVYMGQSARFSVQASGTAPLGYQWRFNGYYLPGQTNTSLVLSNVQPSQAGTYSVLVTNAAGLVASSNALLTVLTAQTNCTPAPVGLVAWWPAAGNALDSISGNSGTLSNGVTFAPGKVSSAFSFNGTNSFVEVPDRPALRLTNALTIEFWVKRQRLDELEYLLEKGGDWTGYLQNYAVAIHTADYDSCLHFLFAGGWRGAGRIADTNWHHCAIIAVQGQTDPTFYIDGVLQPVTYREGASTINLYPATGPLHIGAQVDARTGWFYYGKTLLDELGLYNRPLSAAEILSLYNAGSAGKCPSGSLVPPTITMQPTSKTLHTGQSAIFVVGATGTPPLRYQWRFNGALLPGQTNSGLVISNVQLTNAGAYSVLVTNPFGLALSSNALLTVLTAQSNCTPAPTDLVAWWRAEGNALDSADGHHGLLLNGLSFTNGEAGLGFSFDGINDGILVSNSPSLNFGSSANLSIEAWIKPQPGSTSYGVMTILDKRYTPNLYTAVGYELYLQDGRLSCALADLPNYDQSDFQSAGPDLRDGKFHHVAWTLNRAATNGGKLYVDGQVVLTFDPTIRSGDLSNDAFLRLGYHSDATLNTSFKGVMDEVSIYRRALTINEVQAIYLAGLGGKCPSNTWVKPSILFQPTNQTVYLGQSARFSVQATGTPPLGYQWRFNGYSLPGQTNTSLMLSNVQLAQAGTYSVLVTNPAGLVASSNALLTVLTAQTNCTPVPPGMVAWWRAESNALDSVGGNHGVILNGATFAAGKVGQAFALNGINQLVQIPNSQVLNPSNALTLEAWIYVSAFSANDSVAIIGKDDPYSARQFLLGMGNSTGKWAFRAHVGVPSGYRFFNGTMALQTNTWYHTALTYDGAYLRLFVNGTLDGSLAVSGPIVVTSHPLLIGGHASGPWNFNGRVDELALYHRALSVAELQAIYLAGSAGKCPSGPVAPTILFHPTNQTVYVDQSASFSVGASGTWPMSYQWRCNGTNLPGQTSAVLVLSNVQLTNAGYYSVLVTNQAGAALSSTGLLTVLTAQTNCTPAPAGLVAWWRAESNALDSVDGNHGTLMNGVTYAPGQVGQGFNFNGARSFVQVSNTPALNLTNELTLEFWYKDTGSTGTLHGLVAKRAPYPQGCNFGINFYPRQLDGLQVYLQDPNYLSYQVSACLVPQPGVFHHLAATYRQITAEQVELKTYVDGRQVKTGTVPGNLARTLNNAPLTIGADNPYEAYFIGIIDELALYRRALSSSEIQAIYLAGSAGKCPSSPVAPVILFQPTNQTVYLGQSARFGVQATGTPPLGYQWRFNGYSLPGQTNTSLVLSNVQLAQAGTYSVLVTNPAGLVASSNVLLTVLTAQTNCTPAPPGMVAWWRAESNALDSVDGNHGTFLPGTSVAPGKVRLAFNFTGMTNSYIEVPDAPTLRLTNTLSIEFWVKRQRLDSPYAEYLLEKGGDWTGGQQNYAVAMHMGQYNYCLHFLFAGGWRGAGRIADTNWHHCAIVATNGQADPTFYIDGVPQAVTYRGGASTINLYPSTGPLHIGAQVDTRTGWFYYGKTLLDELGLYNRGLSAAEVQAIYLAGSAGKCPSGTMGQAPFITRHPQSTNIVAGAACSLWVTVEGTRPLTYQWRKNSLPLPGATNSFLTISNARPADAGTYSVVVSNAYGSALSSHAVVNVLTGGKSVLISGFSMNSTIQSYLTALGYDSTLVPYSAFSSVPLTNFNAIWLGSGVYLSAQRSNELVNFVTDGGILVVEMANPFTLPICPFGRQLAFSNAASDTVRIVDEASPVNAGLSNAGLSGWSASVHGYFTGISSFTGLTDTGSSGRWVTIQMSLGKGFLIYTTQDISYHIQYGYGATGPTSPKGLFLDNLLRLSIPTSRPVLPHPGTLLPPTPGSRGLQVHFVGLAGRAYTLQRATSVSGPWMTLTNVTVGENGVGSYLDTTAPPTGAYYRALNP